MNSSAELIKAQLDLTEKAARNALLDMRGICPMWRQAPKEHAEARLRAVEACRKALTHYEAAAALDPDGVESAVQLAITRILTARQVEADNLRELPK